MTKLDLLLARIRQPPPDRQEAIVEEIQFRLDNETQGSAFTDEEWAAIEPTLDQDEAEIPHDQIVAEFRAKYPG